MKRVISVLMISAFLLMITVTKSTAQIDKNNFTYVPSSSVDIFSLFMNKKYFVEMRLNDVNIKAMRDFVKSFQNVQNEKWYKISDGFVSSFTEDGVQTKVVYDLKGRRHCTLRAFNEQQTPVDIRSEIKSNYYDYNIIVIYQIKFDRDSSYIAKIETSKSLKILQISDGEITVQGDYTKQ